MYSSATTSNSASGLRAGGEGEGFGEREAEGEGEAEIAMDGDADDFGLAGGDAAGLADGVGETFCSGFTGPVGLSGVEGVGLGVGEGEGAACAHRQQKMPAQ